MQIRSKMCPSEVQISSVFEDADHQNNIETTNIEFLIDPTSLRECPLKDNAAIYNHLGSTVTRLTVHSISEEELQSVFGIFKGLQHLALHSVNLLCEDASAYPSHLLSLTLSDCKVNRTLADKWFRALGPKLTSIHLSRSHYKLSLDHEGSLAEPDFLCLLPNVRHLTLKESGVIKFACPASTQELSRLELVAKKCVLTGRLLFLKYLSYDVYEKVDGILGQLDCKETLLTLVLRNCPRNLNVLAQLKSLKHLRILNAVDAAVKCKLTEMLPHLQTLDVYCAEPVVDNQLLVLDDDSLIQVLSYLSLDDWISLLATHPRLEHLVCTYMLAKKQVTINDNFLRKYPLAERKDVYACLGKHTRSLNLSSDDLPLVLSHFVNLQKLYVPHRAKSSKALNMIPNNLQKLDLFIHHMDQSFAKLFRRLDRTLTSLEVCGPFDGNDLKELHNVRELKLGGSQPPTINISEFLHQNRDHLERLEIKFYDSDPREDFYMDDVPMAPPTTPFALCPLKRLKVLRLDSLNKSLSLLPADFPALEEIRMSFDMYANSSVARTMIESVLRFVNLQKLHINGLREYHRLYRMRNLRCLEAYEQFMPESVILELINNLPYLESIGTENESFSLQFELDLQKMMLEQKRRITLYHCVWPSTKITFGIVNAIPSLKRRRR